MSSLGTLRPLLDLVITPENELPAHALSEIRYKIMKYSNNACNEYTQNDKTDSFSEFHSQSFEILNDTNSLFKDDFFSVRSFNCNTPAISGIHSIFDETETIIPFDGNKQQIQTNNQNNQNINNKTNNKQCNTNVKRKKKQKTIISSCYDTYNISELTSNNPRKPYKCPECNGVYTSIPNLKSHYKIHTNKAHSCDYFGCHFKSVRRKQLIDHQRVHTGERPFVCNYCNKAFKHKHTLKSHQLIHTGQKPFTCGICNRKFKVKCNLAKHINTHKTIRKLYFCIKCNKHLKSKEGCIGHARRFHYGSFEYFDNKPL